MNTVIKHEVIGLIASKMQEYKVLADNFVKSRFLLASVEYGQNEEEMQALQKIADGIQCTIYQTDAGIGQSIDYDNNDAGNYLEIIEEGMPAPYSGGDGGIVHNPDGTFKKSNVDPKQWGVRLDTLAKPGSDILNEVSNMLRDLIEDELVDVALNHKKEISNIIKPYVAQTLRETLR